MSSTKRSSGTATSPIQLAVTRGTAEVHGRRQCSGESAAELVLPPLSRHPELPSCHVPDEWLIVGQQSTASEFAERPDRIRKIVRQLPDRVSM